MIMAWYQWFSLVSLVICLAFISIHLARLIRLGKPRDYSSRAGNISRAVRYSLTGAMSPAKKESAYLHLPTYSAGIFYHLGTFLGIIIFLMILFEIKIPSPFTLIIAAFFLITGLSGLGIFIKRSLKHELRSLSIPDDYISNLLVTVFQLLTAASLIWLKVLPVYFIWTGLLLLYIPVGKLRHLLYFFAARYQLGYFYGWRDSWPPKKTST
jgi:hypothetical protein